MKSSYIIFFIFFCSACLFSPGKGSEEHRSNAEFKIKAESFISVDNNPNISGIEFGFSDSTGKQILMIANDTLDNPSVYAYTISNNAKLLDIKFIQKKKTRGGNDRENWYNFNNCGGFLYETFSGKVDREHSVLLFTKDFLENRKLLAFTSDEKQELPKRLKKKIENEKKFEINNTKELARIDENRGIYLIEFYPRHDTALAVLAYITPAGIVYKDFPAAYNVTSTWRVDDGGHFGIDDFIILAVFDRQGSIEIATDWAGEEDYSIEYIKEDDAKFTTLKSGYRYTAPM